MRATQKRVQQTYDTKVAIVGAPAAAALQLQRSSGQSTYQLVTCDSVLAD
jgi:hypothetical protein